MRKNRTRPLLGWILLLLSGTLIIAAVIGLEYLGRAKPQQTVDQAIDLPDDAESDSVKIAQ